MIDQRKEEQWDDYAEHYDYMHLVQEAGFGEDHQAYESCWKRTLKYYEDQGL